MHGHDVHYCPECHANVYADAEGRCYECETKVEKLPKHRKRWHKRASKNADQEQRRLEHYWGDENGI